MSILVAGATGRIGGATLIALNEAGERPLALVRSPERAAELPVPATTRVADLIDAEALPAAMHGIDALLLCSGHAPDMLELQRHAIVAARAAGVGRIVKISASPASIFDGTPSRVAAAHAELERLLAESGAEHASVRPNAFAQLVGGWARDITAGELVLTLGEASVSWVDARDVGAVAAAALTSAEPLPETIEVTGPEALGGDALAGVLSAHLGAPVAYRPISDAENRERMRRAGAPEWLVDHVVTIFALLRDRGGERITDAVPDWTGRPATPLRDVLSRDGGALGLPIAPTTTGS